VLEENRYQQIKFDSDYASNQNNIDGGFVDGVFELRHNKFPKCLVIIQFGISIIIWMDAPNNRLIGRLPRILLPTVAAEAYPRTGWSLDPGPVEWVHFALTEAQHGLGDYCTSWQNNTGMEIAH
jgi:hypothetical protein